MTDGELPLTDTGTNLLGPNSLMPITEYLNYGATPGRPAKPSAPDPASYAGPPISEADLQRFRNSGRKRSRHKRGGGGGGCPNSYSNNSFDHSNVESNARTHSMGSSGGGGGYRESFRRSPHHASSIPTTTTTTNTTNFGRQERTTSGRRHKYTTETPTNRHKVKEHRRRERVASPWQSFSQCSGRTPSVQASPLSHPVGVCANKGTRVGLPSSLLKLLSKQNPWNTVKLSLSVLHHLSTTTVTSPPGLSATQSPE